MSHSLGAGEQQPGLNIVYRHFYDNVSVLLKFRFFDSVFFLPTFPTWLGLIMWDLLERIGFTHTQLFCPLLQPLLYSGIFVGCEFLLECKHRRNI